jgi:hypothetical protein
VKVRHHTRTRDDARILRLALEVQRRVRPVRAFFADRVFEKLCFDLGMAFAQTPMIGTKANKRHGEPRDRG